MMDAKSIHAHVKFLSLNYQGEVFTDSSLSQEEFLIVKTSTFAQSISPDFRSRPEFSGIKLFSSARWIGVSLFLDAGAIDDWKRPVLSASAILVDASAWNSFGRDLKVIKEFLATNNIADSSTEMLSQSLYGLIQSHGSFSSRGTFAGILGQENIPIERIAQLIHSCAFSQNVVIYTGELDLSEEIMSILLALLPESKLHDIQISTVCHNIETTYRENIVFSIGAKASTTPKKRLQGIIGRRKINPDALCEIDLYDGAIPLVRSRTIGPDFFSTIINELTDGPDWEELPFIRKRQVLLKYLNIRYLGAKVDFTSLSEEFGLCSQAAERLKEFHKDAS